MQDGTISEFDGRLWGSMVEFVTVGRDKTSRSPSGTARRYRHNRIKELTHLASAGMLLSCRGRIVHNSVLK